MAQRPRPPPGSGTIFVSIRRTCASRQCDEEHLQRDIGRNLTAGRKAVGPVKRSADCAGADMGESVKRVQREAEGSQFLTNFIQAGRAEILHAHQFRLGARRQVADGLHVEHLKGLAGANGKIED